MTISTRKGDEGMSSANGRLQCRKDSELMEALGTLDELVSVMGWLSITVKPEYSRIITSWQHTVKRITEEIARQGCLKDAATMVQEIENDIQNLHPPPLRDFVVPGSDEASARAHIARTICRKAERRVLSAVDLSHAALPVLNRLSDALFVMANTIHSDSMKTSTE